MSLSKETLKNLFDVLKTVSLAITAVSLALLSNAVLSANRDSEKAEAELLQLLRLKEELAVETADQITDKAVFASGIAYPQSHWYNFSTPSSPNTRWSPFKVPLRWPEVFEVASGNPYGSRYKVDSSKTIAAIITLQCFITLWDDLCKTIDVWDVADKIDSISVTGEKRAPLKPSPLLELSFENTPKGPGNWHAGYPPLAPVEPTSLTVQGDGSAKVHFDFKIA